MKEVSFKEGYIVSYTESFSNHGDNPMSEHFVISAKRAQKWVMQNTKRMAGLIFIANISGSVLWTLPVLLFTLSKFFLMAAQDNIAYFVSVLRTNEFEGFRSELYIPVGCFYQQRKSTCRCWSTQKWIHSRILKPASRTKGEIPDWKHCAKQILTRSWKPIGKSGFTIAAGFDVSKHGINDLKNSNSAEIWKINFSLYCWLFRTCSWI